MKIDGKKGVPQPRIELGISGSQPDEMTIFLLWQSYSCVMFFETKRRERPRWESNPGVTVVFVYYQKSDGLFFF